MSVTEKSVSRTSAQNLSRFIARPCSRESCCRTIHTHGKAHSSTPNETSRISWQQTRSTLPACVRFLHSIEHCGNRTYLDPAFHSPRRVRRESCRSRNGCAAFLLVFFIEHPLAPAIKQ